MAKPLLPDALWRRIEPLLPEPEPRRFRDPGREPVEIEEQADGKLKYAFSNLPEGTRRLRAVRLWKSRWPVEQGDQQMKEELGLDHFEGRSWRGFHHHACLVMLAYGFLASAAGWSWGPGPTH